MTLKKITYFMAVFENGRVRHVTQTPHTEDDPNDGLEAWLNKNTFGEFYSREFHGSNGVYCLLKISEKEIGNIREIEGKLERSKTRGVKRPYRHTIKVISQPADRDLPSELVQALKNMKYTPADPTMFGED